MPQVREPGPSPIAGLAMPRPVQAAAAMAALRARRTLLERALADELARPGPDRLFVIRLKREQLRLKEEMDRLVTGSFPPTGPVETRGGSDGAASPAQ